MNAQLLTEMIDRFLSWPLPESVCSDLCVTEKDYCTKRGFIAGTRSGTNLLTADEARKMLEHVVAPLLAQSAAELERVRKAIILVRGHTSYTPVAPRELLAGLLASIERIADQALASRGGE